VSRQTDQPWAGLCIEKALEIEGIGHGTGLVAGWYTRAVIRSRSGR
jgi:hypothetical protein